MWRYPEYTPNIDKLWVRLWYTIAPIIIIFSFAYYCVVNNANNYYLTKLPKLEIKGTISNKFIDKKNRNSEVLLFKNSLGSEERLDINWINLYDTASLGDKILKPLGERDLKLIKDNGDTVIVFYDKSGYGKH